MLKNKQSSADVSIVRTSPSSLADDIVRILDLSRFSLLDPQKKTYIKINGNCDKYYPGSNTSPWFLDAFLSVLQKKKFKDLVVIEGNLYEFTVEKMLTKTHLAEVLKHRVIKHLNYEKLFRHPVGFPQILENSQIINLPVMHTHGFAKISCATKNLWGFLPVTRRHLHNILNQKLIELYSSLSLFTIVDGTVGLYGDSTRTGIPKRIDLVVAGWDTLTIDHTVSQLLGFQPTDIPLLVEATSRHLLKKYLLKGDFDRQNLPISNFSYQDTLERKITCWLEALDNPNSINKLTASILHAPGFDFLYNRMRMIYNDYQFSKKRNRILIGDWIDYEKSVPYINFSYK